MANKKYVSLNRLSTFLDNLKDRFATLNHKHTISDITNLSIDSELSSTSVNPVQNKILNNEFEAISNAMGALELAIDGKSESSHKHNASDITSGTLSSAILPTIPIEKGGTGATTADAALTNLGVTAITNDEIDAICGVTN